MVTEATKLAWKSVNAHIIRGIMEAFCKFRSGSELEEGLGASVRVSGRVIRLHDGQGFNCTP